MKVLWHLLKQRIFHIVLHVWDDATFKKWKIKPSVILMNSNCISRKYWMKQIQTIYFWSNLYPVLFNVPIGFEVISLKAAFTSLRLYKIICIVIIKGDKTKGLTCARNKISKVIYLNWESSTTDGFYFLFLVINNWLFNR